MPHIISSRVTQYQAQVITGVTICRKFINSLIIRHGALSIGHWAFIPYSLLSRFLISLTLPISPVL
ncbi:MAG: hypothetical protein V7L02_21790 [Nostoc sp.]